MKQTTWRKLPSVTRAGKWFYNAQSASGKLVTVMQAWRDDYWRVYSDGVAFDGVFITAKEAMQSSAAILKG